MNTNSEIKSIVDTFLEITEQIVENLKDNVGSVCTLIDLPSAFDTVDHKILPKKANYTPGEINLLLVLDHTLKIVNSTVIKTIIYQTQYNKKLWCTTRLNPGFLLFLGCRHNRVEFLADDSALYLTTKTINRQQVNSDSSKIEILLLETKLTINKDKTATVETNRKEFSNIRFHKYLGLTIDEKLKFKHISLKLSKTQPILAR